MHSMSSPQQSLDHELGAATNRPVSSPHQSLDGDLGVDTESLVSSPHQSLDRELGAATNKLPPTTHQAALAVLFTTERLCDIVGRLPFKEIVSATGTCKFWRSALEGDQNVQEALFLKPTDIREVICDNHLLNNLDRPIAIGDCTIIGKVHPFVYNVRKLRPGEGRRRSARSFPKLEQLSGGWREMFATQPPCRTAIVTIQKEFRPEQFMFERDTGVTIGDLKDLIDSKLPDDDETAEGRVSIIRYVDQDSLMYMRFASKCKVSAGEIFRPTGLPLPIAQPDSESSDDFVDDDDDDDGHWDSDFDEDGYYDGGYDGGDFADDDLRNDPMY
jgi:hypothetical protein